jgi:hypothetical protein
MYSTQSRLRRHCCTEYRDERSTVYAVHPTDATAPLHRWTHSAQLGNRGPTKLARLAYVPRTQYKGGSLCSWPGRQKSQWNHWSHWSHRGSSGVVTSTGVIRLIGMRLLGPEFLEEKKRRGPRFRRFLPGNVVCWRGTRRLQEVCSSSASQHLLRPTSSLLVATRKYQE